MEAYKTLKETMNNTQEKVVQVTACVVIQLYIGFSFKLGRQYF